MTARPVPFCDVTCPTQQTRTLSDCECGGAARQAARVREDRRENRPTMTPDPNRPTDTLDEEPTP